MFNIRNVREHVSNRAAILNGGTEEQIHDLYQTAIRDELKRAKETADRLKVKMQSTVEAKHPDKGWVMVDAVKWREMEALFDTLSANFR